MKTLLKKEFCFTAIPLTYIFLLASLMAFLPGYPILCGPFFICLGIFYTFQIAREGNDTLYTSLLPVKKSDVVRARYYWVIVLQMIAFVAMSIITIIRMTVLSKAGPYISNALMNANFMFLGFTLMIFAAFNTFFVGGFWKDAYRIGIPFLKAGIAIFVLIGIAESIHFFPGMGEINTAFGYMPLQLGILLAGIVIYILANFFSIKASVKSFEKIDLHL